MLEPGAVGEPTLARVGPEASAVLEVPRASVRIARTLARRCRYRRGSGYRGSGTKASAASSSRREIARATDAAEAEELGAVTARHLASAGERALRFGLARAESFSERALALVGLEEEAVHARQFLGSTRCGPGG